MEHMVRNNEVLLDSAVLLLCQFTGTFW